MLLKEIKKIPESINEIAKDTFGMLD